jgi:hypothetical protein
VLVVWCGGAVVVVRAATCMLQCNRCMEHVCTCPGAWCWCVGGCVHGRVVHIMLVLCVVSSAAWLASLGHMQAGLAVITSSKHLACQ